MIEEKVLVIPRDQLFDNKNGRNEFQGFNGNESLFQGIFKSQHLIYRPRNLIENEIQFKQIIPYNLICQQGKVLGYQRTKLAGEKRLHGKWSVGFGGHMNDGDKDFIDARARELKEEIDLSGCNPKEPYILTIGYINDDSTEVGQVHFGIVGISYINEGIPKPTKDNGLANICWKTRDEWLAQELESWSTLVLQNIFL